jgi:peptidoglycan/LPS O-acetylase OafA/YrhL
MKKSIPALDGVRGIAVLLVMWFHYFQINNNEYNKWVNLLSKLSVLGQTGVDLFFVLSGFLITRILLSAKKGKGFFVNFYMRRFFRIVPLYFLFLCVYYFWDPLTLHPESFSWRETWPWWLSVQNIAIAFHWPSYGPNHYWSLAVEEHFYLVWPLLVYLVSKRRLKWYLISFIALSLLLRVYMLKAGGDVFYFTFTRLDAISMGALLALFEIPIMHDAVRSKRIFTWGLLFSAVPLVCIFIAFSGKGVAWVQSLKYTLTGLFYSSLVGYVLCLGEGAIQRNLLVSETLRFIGKISFGLYVWHQLCFSLVREKCLYSGLSISLFVSFSISMIVAYLTYVCWEAPFLKLKVFFIIWDMDS